MESVSLWKYIYMKKEETEEYTQRSINVVAIVHVNFGWDTILYMGVPLAEIIGEITNIEHFMMLIILIVARVCHV